MKNIAVPRQLKGLKKYLGFLVTKNLEKVVDTNNFHPELGCELTLS